MKLEIDIPDGLVTVEQAKALRSMKHAQLLVVHADGTGCVIKLDPLPHLPTAMDVLNLKMRMNS